jgi:hypothetical protein
MENKQVEEAIEALKASPMFNLSLSSKELFHSNFLAWLADTYREQFMDMLTALVGKEHLSLLKGFCEDKQRFQIDREAKNFDFCIMDNGRPVLVLENKVKSVASLSQLKEYERKVEQIYKNTVPDNICYILLSLAPVSKEISKANSWKVISYERLSEEIRACFLQNDNSKVAGTYHYSLIEDYCNYISNFYQLEQYQLSEDKEVITDPMVMQGLRIDDIWQKIVYSKLLDKLNAELRKNGFEVLTISATEIKHLINADTKWNRGKTVEFMLGELHKDAPLIMTNFNYTLRGGGLVEMKFKLGPKPLDGEDDFICTIQYQDNNYRIGLVFKDKEKYNDKSRIGDIRDTSIIKYLKDRELFPGKVKINEDDISEINQFAPFFFGKKKLYKNGGTMEINIYDDNDADLVVKQMINDLKRYVDKSGKISINKVSNYLKQLNDKNLK